MRRLTGATGNVGTHEIRPQNSYLIKVSVLGALEEEPPIYDI